MMMALGCSEVSSNLKMVDDARQEPHAQAQHVEALLFLQPKPHIHAHPLPTTTSHPALPTMPQAQPELKKVRAGPGRCLGLHEEC